MKIEIFFSDFYGTNKLFSVIELTVVIVNPVFSMGKFSICNKNIPNKISPRSLKAIGHEI